MQGTGKNLLLHACCAPCAAAVLEKLSQHFSVTCLFYNPNIHPEEEHTKRVQEMRRLCSIVNVRLIEPEYEPEKWCKRTAALDKEPEGGKRCSICFEMRLEEAARSARAYGIAAFTSTLTISPHKNASVIHEIGWNVASMTGIEFLPYDFKKNDGFRRSCELSKLYGLYRQNYCGCRYSSRQESRI